MTLRLKTRSTLRPRWLACAALACTTALVLAGCVSNVPRTAQGTGGSVVAVAPKLTAFSFLGTPIAEANDFAPWAALAQHARDDDAKLALCLADTEACESLGLKRFRRMIELARDLAPREQLNLVHHYFNAIEWTHDARDVWSTVYHTASERRGDCEDIALAKYQALRMLGWSADRLRIVVGWDGEERDWHALLAVQLGTDTLILDSINGLQSPSLLGSVRLVYSISEKGVWDHAPNFVPRGGNEELRMTSQRAARIAALESKTHKGVMR